MLVTTIALLTLQWSTYAADIHRAQGEMVGEVDTSSAILQSRLTAIPGPELEDGDVPGAAGIGQFEYSKNADFSDSTFTGLEPAKAENDFILKAKITGLTPATLYHYRLHYGPDRESTTAGPAGTFSTLEGADSANRDVSFVVVTGMNYTKFHYGRPKKDEPPYDGPDKDLGYPALAAMLKLQPAPDFFVATGDNVYYDSRDEYEATEISTMRRKWHKQLVQPRFVDLFRSTPTYWEKDDHDHRYNDCDREGDRAPLSDLGIEIFREQVPVIPPGDDTTPTYRTFRVNKHLQIWLVEGRDYRSPNKMEDGPDKTLWGAEQIAWLKKTLSESDATHKLLISPTPMVGPDDAYKIDNHTNHKGFRHEGRAFFDWIVSQGLHNKGFAVLCGDRHWQYHSIDPTGIEEFSSGAICDANARLGRNPGNNKSTDPDATIVQPHSQKEPSGGFLRVVVSTDGKASFEFYDEEGAELYRTVK
jgi:alkaline phosphatase/alkaline phosphatase D